MTLATAFPRAVLETILNRLAALFLVGADGDGDAARDAATHMLAAYHPETLEELRLAASIIGFSFHSLEALGQAAAPDIPLTRVLRLRGNAVSLNRESEKASRCLDQLQKTRRQGVPAEPEPVIKTTEPPRTPHVNARHNGQARIEAQAEHDRQVDIGLAASLKRVEDWVTEQTNREAFGAAYYPQAAVEAV